jgi:hypothetical protein
MKVIDQCFHIQGYIFLNNLKTFHVYLELHFFSISQLELRYVSDAHESNMRCLFCIIVIQSIEQPNKLLSGVIKNYNRYNWTRILQSHIPLLVTDYFTSLNLCTWRLFSIYYLHFKYGGNAYQIRIIFSFDIDSHSYQISWNIFLILKYLTYILLFCCYIGNECIVRILAFHYYMQIITNHKLIDRLYIVHWPIFHLFCYETIEETISDEN